MYVLPSGEFPHRIYGCIPKKYRATDVAGDSGVLKIHPTLLPSVNQGLGKSAVWLGNRL